MTKSIRQRSRARTIGLVGLAAAGCGSDDEIASQRDKWREQRPEQYVVQTCGTGFVIPGCSVLAVESNADSDPIEGMFDTVEATDCDVTKLTFDPTYGFIKEYYLDCSEEGFGSVVRCFAANTVDTSRCGS